MVKITSSLATLSLLLLTSCDTGSFGFLEGGANNGNNNPSDEKVEVVLSLPARGSLSRTELAENLTDVEWSLGDEIALFADGATDSESDLKGEKFKLKYYGATYDRADFTGSISAMNEEQEYTYRAFYPYTTSITEEKVASYTLPSSQDGIYDGKYDFRVADGTMGAALTSAADDSFALTFRSLTHALRISIPEGGNAMGAPIKRLIVTLTTDAGEAINVVGDMTLDMQNAGSTPTLSAPSNVITAELGENTITAGDGNYIWLFINPLAEAVSGKITISAVGTGEEWSYDTSASFTNRSFTAGHITPINTQIGEEIPSTTLTISIPEEENNIGEPLERIKVTAPAGAWFKESLSNYIEIENDGSGLYTMSYITERAENAFRDKSLNVVLETQQTRVPKTIALGGLIDNETNSYDESVPYLMFEDFKSLKKDFESNTIGGTSCSAGDTSQGSKDAIDLGAAEYGLPAGWSGARVGGKAGEALRVACRYQSGADLFTTVSDGRLDSPALGYIRDDLGEDGAQIIVKFKYKGGRHAVYKTGMFGSVKTSNEGVTTLYAGITNTQGLIASPAGNLLGETVAGGHDLAAMDIYGLQGSSIANDSTTNGKSQNYTNNYLSTWGEYSIYGASNKSRLSWSASTTYARNDFWGAQGNFWVYVTEVVVQVVPQN